MGQLNKWVNLSGLRYKLRTDCYFTSLVFNFCYISYLITITQLNTKNEILILLYGALNSIYLLNHHNFLKSPAIPKHLQHSIEINFMIILTSMGDFPDS